MAAGIWRLVLGLLVGLLPERMRRRAAPVLLAVVLIATGVIDMGMIDASLFCIVDDWVVPMLVAAIFGAFVAAVLLRRKLHDDAAQAKVDAGEIESVYDLAYDRRYDFTTVVCFILGVALGLLAAPAASEWLFTNAGMWTYIFVAMGLAAFLTVVLMYVFHFGVRKFIVKAAEYVAGLKDAVDDAKNTVSDSKSDDGASEDDSKE